jgi:hypothetical protein
MNIKLVNVDNRLSIKYNMLMLFIIGVMIMHITANNLTITK